MVQKRKVLADLMSVSLEQYPYFPDDYFPEKLIEGMSIEEVHRIMIGYEKVYNSSNCSEDSSCYEVYYYFSTDENKADRIQIMYDENFAIQKIMQEDNNSKTLTTNGWDEGLIER